MADVMEFPKTMQEFVENYSFIDIDEVYTNGCMLVPTFRVEQAIEHYEKEIRAKAIDEFAEVLKEKNKTLIIGNRMIDEIAEQLKGGVE